MHATAYRYREIGDNITDLFFAFDPALRCTYWNAAAENLTGISAAEALGQSVYRLFPDIEGTDAEAEYAAAVQECHPRTFLQTSRHTGKALYFEVTIYPSRDDFSVLAKDVTYRKQMEDALKKSWDYLENLNNSLGDAILTITMPEQEIEYVNRAVETVFGYSIDECIGRHTCMFFQDDRHWDGFSRRLHAAFDQGDEVLRLEHVVRKKDGALFMAEITTTFLQEAGELSGIISIMRDVSERKAMELALEQERASLARKVDERTAELQRMNARLERASKLKDEFLANMSHELRTPLNAILGYAKLLQKGDNLSPLQAEGLETIQTSGEHLLHLITDILDLSKIEAGRLELHPTALHLREYLQHLAKMIRVRAAQKRIDFLFDHDPALPEGVYADEKRMREVLINLLDNAVKFTDQGFVRLRVSLLQRAAAADSAAPPPAASVTIRFEVEDTGAGIAPGQLDSIFLPFQQVGRNRYAQQGTGLGLSITQQLVKVMGGTLRVESIEQEGSLFWFDLTLPEAGAVSRKPGADHPKVAGYRGPQRKILIADDTRENRLLMTHMLLPLGFDVLEAENGEECIELALREQPDAILLDLLMPVMDGFESARIIRRTPEIQHIPLIAVSASVFDDTVAQSLEAGCTAFLPKPLSLHRLLDSLHAHAGVEWTYRDEQSGTASASARTTARDQALRALPADTRQALRMWAQRGNITRLLALLRRLEAAGEPYQPLVAEFRKYTKNFQVHHILTDLDRTEAEHDPDSAINSHH